MNSDLPPAQTPSGSADGPSPVHRLAVAILAVAFLLFPYLLGSPDSADGALGNELVGDGLELVTNHEVLRGIQAGEEGLGATLTSTWWGDIHPTQTLYRPASTFVLGLAGMLAGEPYDPEKPGDATFPYHLFALALNALCALLVLELAWAYLGNRNMAFIAGALFATLPIHAEALLDVAGIAELLCTAFSLAAWLAWVHAGDEPLAKPLQLGLSLLFLFLATLAKESAFALPLVFFLSDVGTAREGSFGAGVKHALGKAPALGACAAVLGGSIALRMAVTDGPLLSEFSPWNELDNPLLAAGPVERVANALRLMGAAILATFGFNFLSDGIFAYSADYSAPQISVLGVASPWNLLGIAGVLGSIGAAIVLYARCRSRAALWLCALGSMLVTANLLFPTGTIFAERLMFFPSVALVLFVAATLGRFGNAGVAAAALLAVGGGLWTHARADEWGSQRDLWRHTSTNTASNSARAHFNYAVGLYKDNIPSLALESFRKSAELYPDFPLTHAHLGLLYAEEESVVSAIDAYGKAVEMSLAPLLLGELTPGAAEATDDAIAEMLHALQTLHRSQRTLSDFVAQLDAFVAAGYETAVLHQKRGESLNVMAFRSLRAGDEAAAAEYRARAEEAFLLSLSIERTVPATLAYNALLRLMGRRDEAAEVLAKLDLDAIASPSEYNQVLLARSELDLYDAPDRTLDALLELLETRGNTLSPEQLFQADRLAAECRLALLGDLDPEKARVELRLVRDHLSRALSQPVEPSEDTYYAQFSMASVLFELGHLDEAAELLETMLQSLEAPTQRVMLGRIYELQGFPEDAREQYRIALDVLGPPYTQDDWEQYAAAMRANGQEPMPAAEYVGTYPSEDLVSETRFALLQLTQELSGEDAVVELLGSWHENAPGGLDANALERAARWRVSLGDVAGAIAFADQLLASFPQRRSAADLRGNLGEVQRLEQRTAADDATLEELVELSHYRRFFFDFEGSLEIARAARDRADGGDVATLEAIHASLADTLQRMREFDSALDEINAALALEGLPSERRGALQDWADELRRQRDAS